MRLGIDDVALLLLIPAHCAEVVAVADAWRGRKVVVRRRRGALPLEAGSAPRIGGSLLACEQRVNEVDRRDQEAEAHDVGAAGGDVVVDLELGLVEVVPARHALRTQHELGEEGHVEANEDEPASDLAPELVVHDAEHLRPPVVQAADHRDQRRTHHHVVEVGDHEVGVVQVDVDRHHAEQDALDYLVALKDITSSNSELIKQLR